MKLKQMLYGISTFIPGMDSLFHRGTGGAGSARYCYSVWLRHLVMAKKSGLNFHPKIVAELGPGDSLGIGIAALISGSEKYYAFDIVNHSNAQMNKRIFNELIALFENKTPIPDEDEFPDIKPSLLDYRFPEDVLDDGRMQHALEKSRVGSIEESIDGMNENESMIHFKVPWSDVCDQAKETVDLIYSQAVLEHVDDLRSAYRAMYSWLRPNGYISHQIDFRCHGTADEWNGHWRYSDFVWSLIRGKRKYLINREPHSRHLEIMLEEGFGIVCDHLYKLKSNIAKNELASRYKEIAEEDLITGGAFIQATKTANK
ncbi:class I SAM-dependent methyltransferase [bacterium]|nr:class I SAM-dependent methyltransferase [bacterium]